MGVARLAEDILELLRAETVLALPGGLQADQTQDPVGGAVEEPDEREKGVIGSSRCDSLCKYRNSTAG